MSDTNEILDYLDEKLQPIVSAGHWDVYSELHDMISRLLSEQPDVMIANTAYTLKLAS